MHKKLVTGSVAAALLAVSTIAGASELEILRQQVDELSGKVKALQTQVSAAAPSQSGFGKRLWDNTRFGGYGELDYIVRRENGNGKGANVYDPHRLVLYVNSDLSDWITLNTELEWEHGGANEKLSSATELSGEVVVEQAFLDFKLKREFNVKAGIMLVPLGATNLYHEPTNFNSTERPELDKYLIPSTWREMGAGIHGSLGDRVDYQLLVMNGLDGSKFSAKNGLRGGRQNMNKDINRNKAVAGRLEVRPAMNLYTNLSFYTANSAKVGTAYTTIAAFDGKYRIKDFEIAGEYVHVYQDDPSMLNDELGHNMSGYWVEGAWHVMPESLKNGKLAEADAVVFARYSELDTQDGGPSNPAKKDGRYDRSYTTFGVAFKPVTQLAIKADYQIYDDHGAGGATRLENDKFQVTLGFVF